MRRTLAAGALPVLLSGLVLSCSATGVADKTGGDVEILRFATIDKVDANGQSPAPGVFLAALERLSGGELRSDVTLDFQSGEVGAETDLVRAIAEGSVDGGWPTTRAFSRAGLRGLEPVEAPLVLSSTDAQRALATGPAAAALLESLEGSGIETLGLAVGSLRRPWSTGPALVEPDRWRGVPFRSYNSPVQEDAVRALGGEPVLASFDFPQLVSDGALRGVELDRAQYDRNGYGALLPHVVSNIVLWPRMTVLSLSTKRFRALTDQQQEWVRAAAAEAVAASVAFPYDETAPAERLCGQGVRFTEAEPAQVVSLQRAVAPVLVALRSDPETRTSMSVVEQVARDFPSAEAIPLPPSCAG